MATYDLWLCNDRGRRLRPLNNLRSFVAAQSLDKTVGFAATLKAPHDTASVQNYHAIERQIRRDWQVQVWRKDRGPSRLWMAYLVLKWGWAQGRDGEETFTIGGYDMNHLLTRRIVAAYAEEAQAGMTDYADDMMKAVVTDSMEDDALPVPDYGTRAWGDLSVAGDVSQGPNLELAFAWDKLLTLSGRGVLPQIARAARAAGTEVYFIIVPASITTTGVTWRFATLIDAVHDFTSGPHQVVFDADAGSLQNWALSYDYSEAENYIYAGGQGEADERYIEQAYDESRVAGSYWSRCEGFLDVRNISDAAIAARVNAQLIKKQPRIEIVGKPVSLPGQAFGRHYGVGDKVLVKAKGQQFKALVMAAIVELDENGKTSETVRLEYRDA